MALSRPTPYAPTYLREGELDSRLRDRDRTIDDLNLRLRELTGLLRKEQATRELLAGQITQMQSARAPRSRRSQSMPRTKKTRRVAAKKAATARKHKPSKHQRRHRRQ